MPDEAWEKLEQDPTSVLIDVRTRAEWGFVGRPDVGELGKTLICVEWASYPDMSINPHFAETVMEALGDASPQNLLFICRSGVRSLRAAQAVSDALAARDQSGTCWNVAEGFEGDLDAVGHRGVTGGWKARGLTWSQT